MSCTHKSTGVVITNGTGIAEGLQHRIGKQQKILHFLNILKTAGDVGNVAHDDLGSLRLASPTLTCVYKQHRAGNQALDHHHPETLLLAPYSIVIHGRNEYTEGEIVCSDCKTTLSKYQKMSYPLLTSDDNARVFLQSLHVMIGCIGHSKDVWWAFIVLPSSVLLHIVIIVDVNKTVGIHRHYNFTNVGVDLRSWSD